MPEKMRSIQFTEPITKIDVTETLSKDGNDIECLVINDKWKIVPTDNPDKPFKKVNYDKSRRKNRTDG